MINIDKQYKPLGTPFSAKPICCRDDSTEPTWGKYFANASLFVPSWTGRVSEMLRYTDVYTLYTDPENVLRFPENHIDM